MTDHMENQPQPKMSVQDRMAKARATAAANREARKAQLAIDDATGTIEKAAARTPSRETMRAGPRGTTEAIGRNGEVLSRKRTGTGDIFAIPTELIPAGWTYQWAAVSVVGNTEILLDQNLMFSENGWRPVPAERYPGRFMPVGHKGSIIRGGQMLMERPTVLSQEAHAEDVRNARQLIADRNSSLKLGNIKNEMASGFEMSGKYRGTGGNVKLSIDPALDVPAPSHTIADE